MQQHVWLKEIFNHLKSEKMDIGLHSEERMISYVTCKEGTDFEGTTTVTLERDSTVIVIKSVPALVCSNCDENILSEKVIDY